MEITKPVLNKLRNNRQKEYYGSEAKEMFIRGLFNEDNWNGGDNIIRQYFSEFTGKIFEDVVGKEVEFNYGGLVIDGEVVISHKYYNDQNYVTIVLHTCSYDEHDNVVDDWHDDIAYFSWYKSRGRTEKAVFNGGNMNEYQYLFVLNALQATEFEFDLE